MVDIIYLAVYILALASVIAIFYSFFYSSRKMSGKISLQRVLSLTKDETARLRSGDSVFLMHLSIILGVSLSIGMVILDPIFYVVPLFKVVLLIISLPIVAGLIAAFAWRIQRLQQSKKVEKELGSKYESYLPIKFTRTSTWLQLVLIIAILLTTAVLILEWFGSLTVESMGVDTIRNVMVVVYYSFPSVNLLQNFDRPLSEFRAPFKLSDVLEGKIDASQIKMGPAKLSEFSPSEKSSFRSCVEIGACENACPATATGRPLSPRIFVRKLKLLEEEKTQTEDPLGYIQENELWSCTSCGSCVKSCPVGVEHLDMIFDLRRTLVASGRLDSKKSQFLQNLTQHRNSLGLPQEDRNSWLKELGLKEVDENPSFEYLLWVGCMESFDPAAREGVKALVGVLKEAEMLDKFAILGNVETCCGDPARRLGEEGLYQELALGNIELFKKYRVANLVLTCPHGCNTFSKEYPALDSWMGNVKVYHEAELFDKLIKEGNLKVHKDVSSKMTIHDPCYLTRYGKVVQPQRNVLSAIGTVEEAKHHGEDTFCCGAGGSNYWYSVPEKKRISHERLDQLSETDADTIVTMCPFCNIMVSDASKAQGHEEKKVKDLAEVLRNSLERKQ